MQSPVRVAELNTIEDYKRLLSLVASDHVYIYRAANADEEADSEFKDPHLRFAVNSSDTFYYACSDSTEFDLTDTADLIEMFDKFGTTGLIAWCARDRNEKPLKELIDDKYHEAFAYAARFYAPEYDYILLCSNEQKPALEAILDGISYSAEIIDADKLHMAYKVRLTEAQHLSVYRLVMSMYRVYSETRIKECKFKYFNGYSVFKTREIVGRLVGVTYDINKGYIASIPEVAQEA